MRLPALVIQTSSSFKVSMLEGTVGALFEAFRFYLRLVGVASQYLSHNPILPLKEDLLTPKGAGLAQGSGIVSLLPEVADEMRALGMESIALVAAGGIVEARAVAASLALGADGVVMGTRFLASREANIATGYLNDVLEMKDGGKNTVRTDVYDVLRGTKGWPVRYNGRGIINQSYLDAQNSGRITNENRKLYEEALQKGDHGWGGESGRLTAYAGCGVGLVKEVKYAKDIIDEVIQDTLEVMSKLSRASSKL